jgi:hypothetical protein
MGERRPEISAMFTRQNPDFAGGEAFLAAHRLPRRSPGKADGMAPSPFCCGRRRTGGGRSRFGGPLLLLLGAISSQAAGQALVIPVGEENWQKPWVPDLRHPGGQIAIPVERRVDVLILGDGYLAEEQPQFKQDVERWYDRFVSLTPFRETRGAFRVRGLWKPNPERSTAEQESWYHIGVATIGEALWQAWTTVRPQYQKALQVPERIQQQNAANAKARLAEARIYESPQ